MTTPTLAFVTPSYGPDLERCALLVESLDRFGPSFRHYIIVDRVELPDFAHLASERTILIESEAVIDSRFFRIPWKGGIWLNWRTLPVRGWISQQIKKLASAKVVTEDVLVMTDSDATFVKPVTVDHFLVDAKVGLLDVDYCADMVPKWTAVATQLLGLDTPPGLRGHVGTMIAWHRGHMFGLLDRIEHTTAMPWQVAIARQRTFSEYILYGVYIREVLGYPASRHAPSTRALVKQPWDYQLSMPTEMERFFADIDQENIAIMIHSKDGLPVSAARPHLNILLADGS